MRAHAVVLALAAGLLGPAGARSQSVDLQLVLAIDSSSSVSMDEFYLQLEGYATAFKHPDLRRAIRSGPNQAIAVSLFEWSSPNQQAINFDWRLLSDQASLETFAAELAGAPRVVIGGNTAIGSAIEVGIEMLELSPFEGGRKVIDISGDGASNGGRPVTAMRDQATFLGVTINGLAILSEEPDLDAYYRRFVIGGPGAFVISARDYTDFADAILKKLLREITTIATAGRGAP
ncbi:MAG: DUF1194 domain-containing protein [Pseudomonadota bacterium]